MDTFKLKIQDYKGVGIPSLVIMVREMETSNMSTDRVYVIPPEVESDSVRRVNMQPIPKE